MFDSPYPFINLGNAAIIGDNPIRKFIYKFKAASRIYLVTIELFSFNVAAIKYCDRADMNNKKNGYKRIFNDGDAHRVITTCLRIMLDFWRRHPAVSFAFYAVPRDLTPEIRGRNFSSEIMHQRFLERYRQVRFLIYRYAMVNLFSPNDFLQMQDSANSIYVLANRSERNISALVWQLSIYLYEKEKLIFEIDV